MFKKTAIYEETEFFPSASSASIASVLLAGGEGSRLGKEGPKGCIEIAEELSLFRHWWNQTKDRSCWQGVMTNSLHLSAVKDHFALFTEKPPYIAAQDEILLDDGSLAPSGNGDFYRWMQHDFDASVVMVVPVDNPFADPLCPRLADLVLSRGHDLVVRALPFSADGMGRLCENDKGLFVMEYLYSQEGASDLGYTALFACTPDFIKRAAQVELPIHLIHRKNRVKKEKFIFDAFFIAKNPAILVSNKNYLFNPVKNQSDLLRTIMLFSVK